MLPMLPKKVKVQIKLVKGRCTVKPSVVVVPPGGTVEFIKLIPDTVYIQALELGGIIKIGKNEPRDELHISKRTRTGIYPYAVFCYEHKKFCTGSSMPIVIVPR